MPPCLTRVKTVIEGLPGFALHNSRHHYPEMTVTVMSYKCCHSPRTAQEITSSSLAWATQDPVSTQILARYGSLQALRRQGRKDLSGLKIA